MIGWRIPSLRYASGFDQWRMAGHAATGNHGVSVLLYHTFVTITR